MRRSIIMLPVLAAGLVFLSGSVLAQSGWSDRGPVFESDTKRTTEQDEAERARIGSILPSLVPTRCAELTPC